MKYVLALIILIASCKHKDTYPVSGKGIVAGETDIHTVDGTIEKYLIVVVSENGRLEMKPDSSIVITGDTSEVVRRAFIEVFKMSQNSMKQQRENDSLRTQLQKIKP